MEPEIQIEFMRSNLNPNVEGPQQHTNGRPRLWVRVNGGRWRRAGVRCHSLRMLVGDLLDLMDVEEE